MRAWRARVLVAWVVLSLPGWRAAAAQSTRLVQAAPAGLALDDVREKRFDAATGLRAPTVYSLSMDGAGVPYIGTEDGPYRFDGSGWRREALPAGLSVQQVRDILFAADGHRWYATRQGAVRRALDGRLTLFSERDGLVGQVVFGLTESRAIDGTPRLVAGTSRGVSWFDGQRFVPMTLPMGLTPLGVMVAAARAPDGTEELWMADAAGGVARFRQGGWTTFGRAEGLTTAGVQFLLPVNEHPTQRLYVAGSGGVFALQSVAGQDRFVRIPGSPNNAFRLEAVPLEGRGGELWVGGADGRIHRWRQGGWSEIRSQVTERHGPVTLLKAVPGHGGGFAVYVSARTAFLARLSYGAAAALPLVRPAPAQYVSGLLTIPGANRHDAIYLSGPEGDVTYVAADGAQRQLPLGNHAVATQLLLGDSAIAPATATATERGVLAVANGIPWRLQRERFESFDAGLDGATVTQLAHARLPEGGRALVAATSRGLFVWLGQRWRARDSLASVLPAMSVAGGREAGSSVLYSGGPHEVRVDDGRGQRIERLPAVGAAAIGTGQVTRICTSDGTTTGARDDLVLALDSERGIFWRWANTPGRWSLLPGHLRRAMANQNATSMVCLPRGQLALGSLTGLALLDVSSPDSTAWQMRAHLSEADGLPSSAITRIAPSGQPGVLWVGTSYGVGLVDGQSATVMPRGRLAVTVEAGPLRQLLADDATLPSDTRAVRVQAALYGFHREEETRVQMQLEAASEWWRSGRPSVVPADGLDDGGLDAWRDIPARYYDQLTPGEYRLTVRATDWAGREYGPIVRQFTVPTPFWRRWPMLLAYLLLVGSGVALAARWRRRVFEAALARTRAAEAHADVERARFEEHVREAQKLESLGALAGGVAHDFNNLLGIIRGNAELARTALRHGRTSDEHLQTILDASSRARDVVRQILTFSRRSSPSRELIDLAQLLRELEPLLRRMVPRTVQLVLAADGGPYLMQGDPTQLQQLVLNLVSNAEYAMRGMVEGVLTIGVSAGDTAASSAADGAGQVVLTVRDTGEGMTPEVRARVFEPFFTTKPAGDGTGLGMAVVHGIVTSHEAQLTVQTAPGAGTMVAVAFPRVPLSDLMDPELELLDEESVDEPRDATPEPTAVGVESMESAGRLPDRSAVDGARVVVVDDEPAVAMVMVRALQLCGHAVEVFYHPATALAYLQEHIDDTDLLLTDQTMPGMTGDLLIEAVHALRADLPVLIMTGYSQRLTAERLAATGVRQVLMKPVDVEVLQRAVADALSGRAVSSS